MWKAALIAMTVAVVAAPTAVTAAPNIVWVMADDLGWGEVGVYPCTSKVGRIATPNIDSLAQEGIQFTQAYAGYTVCAPSRTTLFTARHSGQFVKNGFSGTSLAPGQATTTAQLLQQAGYTTAAFGKVAPLTNPVQQGFHTFLGQVNQGACHNMYPHAIDSGDVSGGQFNFNLTNNWKPKSRANCMADPGAFNYTVDVTIDHGLEWLNDNYGAAASSQAKSTDPFFLYLSFTVPHAGGWDSWPKAGEEGAPVPSDGQYSGKTSWPTVEMDHASVITYLDTQVGRLISELKSTGLDNDTVVFFASDNGAHLEGGHNYKFFNSTGGLLGHKRSLFEGGMRSPSIVRWPGKIKGGQVSDLPWAFWDAMPTLLDLAGAPQLIPSDIDGISIAPTLMGNPSAQKMHDYLYFTWRGTGVPPIDGLSETEIQAAARDDRAAVGKQQTPGYAVRVGQQWKAVVPSCADSATKHPSEADAMMLFDLLTDPFETTDVASSHKAEVAAIKQMVIADNLTCTCYQC